MRWVSTLQLDEDLLKAVQSGMDDLMMDTPDLLFAFFSNHHAASFKAGLRMLAERYPNGIIVGCSSDSVTGASGIEGALPGVSLTAAELPDVEIRTHHFASSEPLPVTVAEWHESVDVDPDQNPVLLVFSDATPGRVERMNSGLDLSYPESVKAGGIPSRLMPEGTHYLFEAGQLHSEGDLVVALYGDIAADVVVCPGARPVGAPLVVTRSDGTDLLELDGRPALRVMQAVYETMTSKHKELFQRSPMIGIGIEDHRGRVVDFLVRNIVRVHRASGMFSSPDPIRDHQTVQFFVRDPEAVLVDLRALLETHVEGYGKPRGGLLFSCVGRSSTFYGRPNQDVEWGAQCLNVKTLGGIICDGEIAPIHNISLLHTYSSVFCLFRQRLWS